MDLKENISIYLVIEKLCELESQYNLVNYNHKLQSSAIRAHFRGDFIRIKFAQ